MKESLLEKLRIEKKKNIVIYGMTQRKCKLSQYETASFQFYFMDLDLGQNGAEKEQLYSLEQAEQCGIDAFVIMRQMIANRGTFHKLMEYCEKHGADIYDENGRNLRKICGKALKMLPSDKALMLELVQQHECISFDIFDTLLTRKVLLPEDVFDITARRLGYAGIVIKNFKERRRRAQEKLGLTNPDIYEIYAEFRKMYKISEDVAKMCWQIELEVESEVLIPRAEMIEIYQKCLEMGKKVCLVSDMYIPADVLEPILEKNGIKGYDALYVSCDKKKLKLQGLLETYRKECSGESYLHVGDHYIHDGICAELAGIDYCLVESSIKMAQRTAFGQCIENAVTLEEHVILGMVIAKIMNSPFSQRATDNKINIESDYDYSYGFCAALISQFALWIYYQVKEEKYDDILFASRDGYLLQKMYKILLHMQPDGSMPTGKYFYTSRKASVMTGINNEAFINMIIDISPGMPPKKMMRERFGLSAAEILEYDEEKYGDSIHKYVWAHVNPIFKRAEEAKQNYYKYMGNIDLQIGKKYAFMDFVSSGTSQKSLKRIVPFELEGLYAGWNGSESMEELGGKALFTDRDTFFMKRFKVMETFLTSEEPSLSCFDEKGNPIFSYQDRTDAEQQYVREMQRACLDFLEELVHLIKPEENSICNELTDGIFAASEQANMNNQESILNHLRLMDDWRKKRNKIEELIQ